jgi:aryl-alcohol dehydrogenase-like predicted oxidoreductase
MESRKLNHTDITVSRVSFGTMTFGSQTDAPAARRMIDRCLDAGVNFFDTANVYNKGQAEIILGKALAGRRDKVILATKVRGKMSEGPAESGLSAPAIYKAIDASLQRLGTDYVDVYYMHAPDYETPIEETLVTMNDLVNAGKVRYPAVSNYAAWQIAEMHCISARNNLRAPYISQPMYNLVARGIEEEFVPFTKRFGVSIVPYNPLAGGLLTGKYMKDRKPIPGGRFDHNELYQGRYWHDDYFAAVQELEAIARDVGRSPVELSLQWLLTQPYVDSVILGASRMEQLEENLQACQGPPLDESILARCDQVWKRLRGVIPKYNR